MSGAFSLRALGPTIALAALIAGLIGCGGTGYTDQGSQTAGKKLFVQACGSCHTLANAGTTGTIGPNLDAAFGQSLEAGMTAATVTQVVRGQISYPVTSPSTGTPGMPAIDHTLPLCDDVESGFCVDDQDQAADDIAIYVGQSINKPGAGGGEESTDGKSLFVGRCGGCHTLADAGTSGNVGPNLDTAMPALERVIDRVTHGKGPMPAFGDDGSLNPAQIKAVAEYVSSVAGK